MAKENNNIIQPTEEELAIYKNLIPDIDEVTLDNLTNEYFELVANEQISISFPRFLMDKFIRPVAPGDTIQFVTEERETVFLFCLVRQQIEGIDYLLFCKVEPESETLHHDEVYLFYVAEIDNEGLEVLDIMPNGEETERILDIMEANDDAPEVTEVDSENLQEGN